MSILNFIKKIFSGNPLVKVEDNSKGKSSSREIQKNKNGNNIKANTINNAPVTNNYFYNKVRDNICEDNIKNENLCKGDAKTRKDKNELEYDELFEDFNGKILKRILISIKNYVNAYGLKLLLFAFLNGETNFDNPKYLNSNKENIRLINNYDIWLLNVMKETGYVAFAEYQLGFEELVRQDIIHKCNVDFTEIETDYEYYVFPELMQYLKKHNGERFLRKAIKDRFKEQDK